MDKRPIKRALSVSELLAKKYRTLDFQGTWLDAFGQPESRGVWFIWGASGSGKSTFVCQLCKELSRFGRVVYNSLEEADSFTIQRSFADAGLAEVRRRVLLVYESMEDLSARLSESKSPAFAIIDSFQYTRMNYGQYINFKERHRDKLIIFVSHAEGKQPTGRSAKGVMYDSSLKILSLIHI
jgi:molybdopterin-guanine dinucleotide biosynthesis protein